MRRHGLFLFATIALLAACGGGNGGTTGAGGGGAGAGGGSGGGPSGPAVTGVLADEMGVPVSYAKVVCCSIKNCYTSDADAEGRFFFGIDEELPADYVVKSFEETTTSPRRAATMFPLQFVDTSVVDLGELCAPSLPAGAVLGPKSDDPQTLEVGDGLTLTVNRADLEPPLGGSLYDVAARRVSPQHVPALPELGAEEVVAVYAMYPFATTSASPIAVSAPSDLPAGTVVYFRSISEYNGKLSAPAPGEADGARVTTDLGAGLDELTWIVVSK
ncbi:hypothetical protein [Polyangium spumosum]|uniref:Carboxypeptidase regulatory-like domain-containing protein n=1 Tax=Polyangium spumosum TaxID=889282 RepID=A0A6N7QC35_9BACT|nr:hypothetical protein [Polyangium spumosum]MRG98431.1 hypothetical protein [Polyangium spumosum]